jgi:EmrB/QacA subfamily drug resistance transporter
MSAPGKPARLTGWAQLGLLIGPLLSMVDSSIVNVAVPDIASELGSSLDIVAWAVSGYLFAIAAALAGTSYLARRFGTRRVYTCSLVGFVLVSACCALAPTTGALIAARVLQGALGAPLMPLAMSMLLGKAGAARHLPVLASLLLFLAPALGPTAGGVLVSTVGWRWIFLINLPLGVIGLIGLLRVPAHLGAGRQPGARFDPVGLALLAGGLLLLLNGAHEGGGQGWTHLTTLGALVGGFALSGLYVLWARQRPGSAVDLALFHQRDTALAVVLIPLSYLVIASAIFVLPVFTQTVQGYTAVATGIAMLPQGLITGLSTVAGQKLMARVSVRTLVCAGFGLLAVSSAGLLALQADTPLWVTGAILAGRAAAIGLVISPLLVAAQRDLEIAAQADANTLMIIVQRAGGSLGVSLIASLLTARAGQIGPVAAFHEIGLILTGVALVGLRLAVLLTSERPPASSLMLAATATGNRK